MVNAPLPTAAIVDMTLSEEKGAEPYWTSEADLPADAEKLTSLWGMGLHQGGAPQAKLEWYYACNSEGPPLTVFLYRTDTPSAIAVASVGQRRMRIGTTCLTAGALVDFVAQPEHRTFFPALFLQREIRRRALDRHAAVFGFPNRNSLAIVRRVGHRCIGLMVRRVRVLRSATYLARYMPGAVSRTIGFAIDGFRRVTVLIRRMVCPGLQSQWVERPNDAFDDLWRRAAAPNVLMGFRDCRFLTWRFVRSPLKSYMFFTLVSSADGRLVAYAVCSEEGSALNVDDFLVDPNIPSAHTRLWLDLSREAVRLGFSSLSVEFLGCAAEQRRLNNLGLLVRGERPVYASLAEPPDTAGSWLTEATAWYLTSADDD